MPEDGIEIIDLSTCTLETPTTIIDLTIDDSTQHSGSLASAPFTYSQSHLNTNANANIQTQRDIFELLSNLHSDPSFGPFSMSDDLNNESEMDTDMDPDEYRRFAFDPFRMVDDFDNSWESSSDEHDASHEMMAGENSTFSFDSAGAGINPFSPFLITGYRHTSSRGLFDYLAGPLRNSLSRGFLEERESYENLLALGDRLGQVRKRGLGKERLGMIEKFKYSRKFPKLKANKLKKAGEVCSKEMEKGMGIGNEAEVKEQNMCIVCMEEFKRSSTCKEMPCKHIFHSRCLDKWLLTNANCPICRHQLEI